MHELKVKKVLEKIRRSQNQFSLAHHSSNTLREGDYKKNLTEIDLSSFNEVLTIDEETLIAHVEPSITFEALCRKTLALGLIPEVVPEFSTITVGGAIMGAALESTSHQAGQVSDTCVEYELILGDGSHVFVSKDNEPDLFYGLSGSYGTLGLLLSVKIRLKKAKTYVSLKYSTFDQMDRLLSFFQENKTSDFLDGVAFSDNHFVGIKGNLSDTCDNLYLPRGDWFIAHLHNDSPQNESMKIWDYLFRFDRGAFWMGYHILSLPLILTHLLKKSVRVIQKTSYHVPWLYRKLLSPLFSSRKLYKIWHKVAAERKENIFLIHDFYTPFENVKAFFDDIKENIGIFPIWFCPIKGTTTPQILSPHFNKNEQLINIGVYGIPQKGGSIPDQTKNLEKKIALLGGKKMLYSLTYYDEKSFYEIYEGEKYQKLREKFHAAKAFPSLYNKVIHGTENL